MLAVLFTLLSPNAFAQVAEECVGETQKLDDEGQQNFMLNFTSLALTFSPLHGAIPDDPGRGNVGVELAVLPPLGCERRLIFDSTKTEDTNKSPVAPRLRAGFTFPKLGPVVVYGGAGYTPPVPAAGLQTAVVSAELGAGFHLGESLEAGLRYHHTLMKTFGEIATPFEEDGETFGDFYVGSTFGLDAMFGLRMEKLAPYLAAGVTDVSTFFWIGDDAVVTSNTDPYFGFTGSLGVQYTPLEHLQLAGEFYTAPGYLYTGRLRGSLRF